MKFNLSVVNISQENWQAALSELGLILVEHGMD